MPEPTRTGTWAKSFGTVKSFMLKAINDGMSFGGFYGLSQETGLSYRKTNMLRDWDSMLGVYAKERYIHTRDPNEKLTEYCVTREFYSKNYAYIAGVSYKHIDPLTGETVDAFYAVTMDELQSPNAILEKAFAAFGAEGPYRTPSAFDFKLRYVCGRQK